MPRVTRGAFSTGEIVNGKPLMAPNGCSRHGRGHGWEYLEISGRFYCMACVFEALGPLPIYFTGADGSAVLAAGVKPLASVSVDNA